MGASTSRFGNLNERIRIASVSAKAQADRNPQSSSKKEGEAPGSGPMNLYTSS